MLTGSKLTDTNTLNDPNHVVPVTAKFKLGGAEFSYTFAPYSVTVLTLTAH